MLFNVCNHRDTPLNIVTATTNVIALAINIAQCSRRFDAEQEIDRVRSVEQNGGRCRYRSADENHKQRSIDDDGYLLPLDTHKVPPVQFHLPTLVPIQRVSDGVKYALESYR